MNADNPLAYSRRQKIWERILTSMRTTDGKAESVNRMSLSADTMIR
jgi:hypothetical protein